ncbi:MAG: hypothetical protein JWP74_514 [Marmoricola sp.]|nr:hypothetical protein [Marmoricola sp.]
MARTYKYSRGRSSRRPHRISVRSVQRDPVDLRRLSRAAIALAQAQMEADAEASEKKSTAEGSK